MKDKQNNKGDIEFVTQDGLGQDKLVLISTLGYTLQCKIYIMRKYLVSYLEYSNTHAYSNNIL